MITTKNINGRKNILHIFTFSFEEYVHYLYNKLKKMKKRRMDKIYFSSKNYSQFQENCQRHTLFLQTYTRKNPDYPTEILGWKVSLCEIVNDTLNNLVH